MFGVSPGLAYETSAVHIPVSELESMLLIASRTEEITVDYSKKSELERKGIRNPIRATLEGVVERVEGRSQLTLANVLMDIISGAWGLKTESLRNAEWSLDFQKDVLWADLKRESAR